MPKVGETVEQVKIYWLSNTELDYTFRCDSRAPMGDNFCINFVHRVVQKDKDVEVKIYFKLTFLKDTSMKGMITSKSHEQTDLNIAAFVSESKKIMKSYGGGGGGDGKTEEGGKASNEVEEE
jgi:hypothetical protein